MRGSTLTIEIPLEAVAHARMPPNCEILARAYVGDLQFGLAREPHNRGLFLLSLNGYWHLDTQQLVTAFASALRELERELEYARGGSLTGHPDVPIAAPLEPRRGAWGGRRRAAPVSATTTPKRKAG